jgi:hypothetical protein
MLRTFKKDDKVAFKGDKSRVVRSTGVPGGGGQIDPPPRNSEVLKKLGQIPSSVEYTSVTT